MATVLEPTSEELPADVAPDYWRHVHNRLSVNETPRAYTRSRHQVWLRRRKIAP